MLRQLSLDEMQALTDGELEEYQDHLEELLLDDARKSVLEFAKRIEVPGTPSPVETSDAAQRAINPLWTPPAEFADVEFYPAKLNPALHHELILATVQDLLDETLLTPDGEPIDGVIITAPPGPLHIDSRILMADGTTKALRDVVAGDTVVNMHAQPTTVTARQEHGVLPLLRITTDGGLSILTDTMHLFHRDIGWRAAIDLQVGDKIATITSRRNGPPWQPPAFQRITAIDPAGSGACACLTVADHASFVADGFVVHNSAKSSYASMVLPAFVMGYRKNTNVIGASYAQELSDRFSRRVRSIINSADYRMIFPGARLTEGNTAVRGWSLTNGSEYRSTGVGAGISGFRANVLIMDDLLANREEAESPVIREKVWNAVNDDLLPRAKGDLFKIIAINTRFHQDDHIGRLLGETYKGQSGYWRGTDGRHWWLINLPVHAEHDDDPLGRDRGELLWPQWYKARSMELLRNDKTPQGIRRYTSLYQQRPAPSEGSILLREYWRPWGKLVEKHGKWVNDKEPPEIESLVISYDTATEAGEHNDFSAATMWGIFKHRSKLARGREVEQRHVILMGAWQEKIAAVDLIKTVEAHMKRFEPDVLLIEKRASGAQLIQELKRRRWPVKAWLPKGVTGTRGKVPRAHAVAYILESGSVWYYPIHASQATTTPDDVIDQSAAFPHATYLDLTDSVTQFLAYARDRYLLQIASDAPTDAEEDDDDERETLAAAKGRRGYGGGNAKAGDKLPGRRRLYGSRQT